MDLEKIRLAYADAMRLSWGAGVTSFLLKVTDFEPITDTVFLISYKMNICQNGMSYEFLVDSEGCYFNNILISRSIRYKHYHNLYESGSVILVFTSGVLKRFYDNGEDNDETIYVGCIRYDLY